MFNNSGSEYDAAEDDSNYVVIAPTDETPATLYYYCENHPDMAGNNGNEAEITINYNNPKVFGTGLEILVTDVQTTDTVKGDVSNGNFEVQQITGTTVTVEDITTTNITSTLSTTDRIKTPILSLEQNSDGTDLTTITAIAGAIDLGGTSFKIGDKFTVTGDTGTINTDGIIKTTNQLNVNDFIKITDNNIESTLNNNIFLTPAPNKIVKVDAVTALCVPAGVTSQRPTSANVQNGSIRFNSETNQYEGYSDLSGSGIWSSLGGVRDVDGDTFIKPEVSPGSDEDTLYFFNTNVLSMQLTPNKLELLAVDSFESADNINLNAPTITTHNLATTLDTDDALRARFTTIRSEYEIGFNPTGLANETFLRFNENGEVWINRGLGSGGTESYLRVLDSELETFELERTKTDFCQSSYGTWCCQLWYCHNLQPNNCSWSKSSSNRFQ